MEKFTTLTGVAAPMPVVNIDTDMIIPKNYLKRSSGRGWAKGFLQICVIVMTDLKILILF